MTPQPPIVEQGERVLHWWPIIIAAIGAAWGLVRSLVLAPRARLAALEDKLRELRDGIDELRVAQARMSDVHGDQLAALTARIDRAIELMIGAAAGSTRHVTRRKSPRRLIGED